jgi:hypothetical protein
MMTVNFEGANTLLTKPGDMTDEQCHSTPAYRGVDSNGFDFTLVVFQPNHEDVKAINEGRPILLKVIGKGFPPVALYTCNEKGEANV